MISTLLFAFFLSQNITINDIFSRAKKRGRELHAKYSFALSNLRFRWKEEKKKYSAKHKTMATWLIASLFARRFKFDMKKIKMKLTWLCVLLSKSEGGDWGEDWWMFIDITRYRWRRRERQKRKEKMSYDKVSFLLRLWCERKEWIDGELLLDKKSDELPSIALRIQWERWWMFSTDRFLNFLPLCLGFVLSFFPLFFDVGVRVTCTWELFICMLTKSILVKK